VAGFALGAPAVTARAIPAASVRALALRAAFLWVPVRLIVGVTGRMSDGAASLDSPLGIVLLCCALGVIDIHRRHERALWANLGISLVVIGSLFAFVAAMGEVGLAILRTVW
jgi:hypothetical protein